MVMVGLDAFWCAKKQKAQEFFGLLRFFVKL